MKRRTFLKIIAAAPGLTLTPPRHAKTPKAAPVDIRYVDSLGNSPATLAALGDGDRASGVEYQP